MTELIVFGNGDITSPEDASAMCRATGCPGIALARGILKDPYLLRRIASGGKASTPEENRKDRMTFLRELLVHTRESGGKKWRNGFLECVRMCYEDDPKLFQSLVQLSDKELQERFS